MGDPADDDEDTAGRARQELLAIVSHDLRNPLGSILTSTALLERLELPSPAAEKARKYTAIIQRSADRMNRLISDLLELAAIEGGALPIVRAPVEARALLETSFDRFRATAAEKQVHLDREVKTDPGTIQVDRDRILQVLSSLLGNAVELTPAGGKVMITVDVIDELPTFAVSDSGPGITAEQRSKIFGPYWQAGRTRGAGVGLGLSIARGLIEEHGGTLQVESEAGAGATFSFTIGPPPP